MPTKEEIAAYLSAVQQQLDDRVAKRAAVLQDAEYADRLDEVATAIELSESVTVGSGGQRVTLSGAGVVAAVVTWLRSRAAAIRDAVSLPG